MKETPIIFNTDNIRAILDGRKTMTRRICKEIVSTSQNGRPHNPMIKRDGIWLLPTEWSPYGQVGDNLIIKETWATEKQYDHLKPSEIPDTAKIYFINNFTHKAGGYSLFTEMGKVRSARFMCKWMSRITDREITEVRVERVQEISIEDCKVEGIAGYTFAKGCLSDNPPDARWKFIELWDSINAKKYPWSSNPWVWCISFRRIQ